MRSIITFFFLSINKRLHLFSCFTETFCFELFLVVCGSQDINIAVKLHHSTSSGSHHRNRVGLRPIRLVQSQTNNNYDNSITV